MIYKFPNSTVIFFPDRKLGYKITSEESLITLIIRNILELLKN
ncbi:hypothetical protein LEP1GSC077_0240 [Leptospira interrogans str. C10069]|nr:hypothetical protein LEP1GSC077_0240 [Leptospira interrogans str. C10069]EMN61621.1 hypothetical protein LEP1GSC092_1831 [Leptospira interrogans serovar Pyrogenes str. R168]